MLSFDFAKTKNHEKRKTMKKEKPRKKNQQNGGF